MTCPTCGAANPPAARFCTTCGQPLPRVCPNCGTANPPDARFCMHCGTPLDADLAADTADASATKATRERAPARSTPRAAKRPPPRRRVLSAAGNIEERRVVTVVFADLTGSTVLADRLDPEELRTLLAAYFTRMTRAIRRHGGTVEKYVGDAIMAVFGLPTAHEDDPVRAVRAALDMRRALRAFNDERLAADPAAPELRLHLGVNTGEVVAANGPAAADGGDFLVTGDAVNVAARLQQVAEPDTILVGPRTYRGTRGAVTYHALPPIEVRGKPRPLRVWQAQAMVDTSAVPVPRPRGVEGLRAPLVGRDVEMSLLDALYQRSVGERHAHLVTVLGIPGIGKTRLVRDFISRLLGVAPTAGPDAPLPPTPSLTGRGGAGADVTPSDSPPHAGEGVGERSAPLVLEGRCPPYGEGITYWPLAEMLRAYAGFSALDPAERARAALLRTVSALLSDSGRADDPAVLAAYLGHTIGIETPDRRRALLPSESAALRDGLFRAWRVFFELLAATRPLVILIDDIHWADDALLDLLTMLAARTHDVPLLLLCPARPELLERRPAWGEGLRNAVTLALEPLPDHEAARLVDALLPGDSIPTTLRRGILAKAGGNPFYVEEIIRMLTDRGILYREPMREGAGAGGSVGRALEPSNSGRWRIAPAWEDSDEVRDPVIPDTVQGVLAARLDLLPHEERLILQHASIIGRYFWLAALAGLAPEMRHDALDRGLDALRRKDLIQESEPASDLAALDEHVYTFKHALTREVTYGLIPRARRAVEHARLAEWLEPRAASGGDAVIELLAHHEREYYRQADLARSRNAMRRQAVRDKVIAYLLRAADNAAGRHVAAKAEMYYSEAWELLQEEPSPGTLPLRVATLTRRGAMRWLATKGDAAWADYHAALALWRESGVVERAEGADGTDGGASRAEAGAETEAPPLPGDWAKQGLQLYRLLVLTPTRFAGWFTNLPPHEELRGYLERGLALADTLGLRESSEGAALLAAKSFFWWSWPEARGEPELLDALRSAREAVRIAERLGDARGASEALDALGNMQSTTADLRGYLESQTRRLYWARQIDDVNELVDIQAEVSTAYQLVGEFELAVAHARESLTLAQQAESNVLRAQALRAEVLAAFEWDHWDNAIAAGNALIEATAGTTLAGTHHHRRALLALAIAYARTGQDDDAERMVALLRDESRTPEAQYVSVGRARLALARGADGEAERLLLAALDARSGRYAIPLLMSELAELAARRGQRDLYERFGAQAVELGWRSGARKALAQAIRARGIMATADRHWDDATADLHDALTRYHTLGTRWDEARTLVALAGLARAHGAEGDAEGAEEALRQALAIFEAVGAVRERAAARAALAGQEVRRG
ncbi:MAG TPA: adenylate/guanylate cyclase domain-containing protein [Ktedonobacterales bacterium]